MSRTKVAVFTANSNTGASTIEHLLTAHKGTDVRAIVRKKANGEDFEGLNVEIIEGDIKKPLLLGPVMKDVKACFFATPGTTNRAELGKKFIDTCLAHGVEYGVFISIIGADQGETAYQRQFKEIEEYAQEKAGKPVKLPVGDKGQVKFKPIILRCAPFYQNFYGSLGGIQAGTLYYPLAAERMAHVDFNDIGKCVAAILASPESHANQVYNLIGEYQAGNSIATTIAMKAGVGCKYEDVDDDTSVQAFEALGLQHWIAAGNVEMLKWFRDGNGQDIESDIPKITGKQPTRFADFVRVYLKPMLA